MTEQLSADTTPAEILREAGLFLGDATALHVANAVVARGIELYEGRPQDWPSGVGRGSNPSLMVGQAGIGYAYLRIADPQIPSMLLCGVGWRDGASR